jgi:hypothetical protein
VKAKLPPEADGAHGAHDGHQYFPLERSGSRGAATIAGSYPIREHFVDSGRPSSAPLARPERLRPIRQDFSTIYGGKAAHTIHSHLAIFAMLIPLNSGAYWNFFSQHFHRTENSGCLG